MTKHYVGGRDFEAEPGRGAFMSGYRENRPQVVWTRLVADLETPVSAMLKLGDGQPLSCLLESVEGGATRGRYSIIGIAPDIVWRATGDRAEINRRAQTHPDAFEPEALPALKSLRALLASSRIDLPPELPPIAAGVIGYLGHDTVRLIEHLPHQPPDAIGVPDGMFVRPTLMVVFDNVKDEIIVVTPVRPEPGVDASTAYARAVERLRGVVAALDAPLPHATAMAGAQLVLPEARSNTAPAEYMGMVRARQGVHRRRRRLPGRAVPALLGAVRPAAVRALPRAAPHQPLAVPVPPRLRLVRAGRILAEILVRVRGGEVTIRPACGHAAARRHHRGGQGPGEGAAPTPRSAPSTSCCSTSGATTLAASPRSAACGSRRASRSSATATSCTSSATWSAGSTSATTPSTR